MVLQRRTIHTPKGEVTQLLIKWTSWPEDLATWEDEPTFITRFPKHAAWGQAISQGEGDVTVPKESNETTRRRRMIKLSVFSVRLQGYPRGAFW